MTKREKTAAKVAAIQLSGRYEGALTSIQDGVVQGWAWNIETPYDPVVVEIFAGETRLARIAADKFDPELAVARKGNGVHAFSTTIEAWPESEGPHQVRMFIAGTSEAVGEPLTIGDGRELRKPISGYSCDVHIDGVVASELIGWLTDESKSPDAPHVQLLMDGAPAPQVATMTRAEDIPSEGRLVGGWRFRFNLPVSLLDGLPHALDVRVAKRDFERFGGPVAVGPADIPSFAQGLQTMARRLHDLERRLGSLPPAHTPYEMTKQLAAPLLDHVDSLLALHRELVERELSIYRSAFFSKDAVGKDVIKAPVVPPRLRPAAPTPRLDLEIDENLVGALAGEVDISTIGQPGLKLSGEATIALGAPVRAGEAVVIEGRGARVLDDLVSWVISLDGAILRGRVERWKNGGWRFVSRLPRTVEGAALGEGLLTFKPNAGWLPSTDISTPVTVTRVCVSAFAVPSSADGQPIDLAVHLAGSGLLRGWYSPDEGVVPYCWMAARGMLPDNVFGTTSGRLRIIGENELMDGAAASLKLQSKGLPVNMTLSKNGSTWVGEAQLEASEIVDADLWIVADPGYVTTPEAFSGAPDGRLLSVSARLVMFEGTKGIDAA